MRNETQALQPHEMIPLDYVPMRMRIESITRDTSDTKTFRLSFVDKEQGEKFEFRLRCI